MEKFLYLFRGGMDYTAASPEAMQTNMQKWNQWMGKLMQDGIMQGGEPLQAASKKVAGKSKVVTDGPFAEAKEIVGGYLLINANDINHAVELSKGCPIFEMDGSVEVRPIQKMEM